MSDDAPVCAEELAEIRQAAKKICDYGAAKVGAPPIADWRLDWQTKTKIEPPDAPTDAEAVAKAILAALGHDPLRHRLIYRRNPSFPGYVVVSAPKGKFVDFVPASELELKKTDPKFVGAFASAYSRYRRNDTNIGGAK